MALFGGSPTRLCAQEDDIDLQSENIRPVNKLDKEKWRKASKSYDYNKEKAKEKNTPEENGQRNALPKKSMLSPTSQAILKYTLFVVVIAVLILVAFAMIAGGSIFGNKKLAKEKIYTLDDIEENLENINVEVFLDEAIKSGDYRLATRLYYLNILKSLSSAGYIIWKRDKTNGMYLREMSEHTLFKDFRQSTAIYEYVWFNEQASFEAKDFEQIRPLFRNVLEKTAKALSGKTHQPA